MLFTSYQLLFTSYQFLLLVPSYFLLATSYFTARKTIFSFSKCSEKMVFPKKSHWNMIFLVLSGKMIFLFPENMILFFRRKMKDNLYQKKYMEIWYFLQMFRKDSLSKKKSRWNMIFLVLSGKVVFFFWKIWYFFFGRKMKDDLSEEIHGNIIFFVYMYKCYKYDITLLQKKSKMIFSWKNTLTGNWHSRSHSRKSSNDSLYFYGDLHRRFHMLFSSEKTRTLNV